MNRIPIIKVGVILFFIVFCFLMVGCTQETKGIVSKDDKNITVIQAVLEAEFTGPEKEYTLIQKKIEKYWTEIHESLPESGGMASLPEDTPESIAYEEFLSKTFKPYFIDQAYEDYIQNGFAFSYQNGLIAKGVYYKMKVTDSKVSKSENKNSSKNYEFTAKVEYKNSVGEVTEHVIKGTAILSEEGKIEKFTIADDSGLMEKIQVELGQA